jgi:tight adherence protein B
MTGLVATVVASGLGVVAVVLWWPPSTSHRVGRLVGMTSPPPRSVLSVLPSLMARIRRRVEAIGPAGRRRRAFREERLVEAIHSMSADLAAGHSAERALERAFTPTELGEMSVAPQTLAAVRFGGAVGEALRRDGVNDPVLRAVAVCWDVAAHSGAGLAESLARVATTARMAAEARAEIEAQLAGPRASARMMALLPVLGLLMGTILGADPLTWLVSTGLGWGCLAAGAMLTTAGVVWTSRIARRAERELP